LLLCILVMCITPPPTPTLALALIVLYRMCWWTPHNPPMESAVICAARLDALCCPADGLR
jgi:hypothetical protein